MKSAERWRARRFNNGTISGTRPFRVDKTPNKGEDESSFKSRLIEKTAKRQVKEEEEARQNGQQK